jgi:hypothetical protein
MGEHCATQRLDETVYHRGRRGARPQAAEIRIYAERRAGELVNVMQRSGEMRTKRDGQSNKKGKVSRGGIPSKLKDVGISSKVN